jgi:hypothetical protein
LDGFAQSVLILTDIAQVDGIQKLIKTLLELGNGSVTTFQGGLSSNSRQKTL